MEKRINRVMLPQLSPSVPSRTHLGNGLWRFFAHGLCVLVLLLTLTACSGSQPPRALLNEALSLQIQLTQTAISKSLNLPPISLAPNVSRVRVEEQEALNLGEQKGFGCLAGLIGSCQAIACRWIVRLRFTCSEVSVVRAGGWHDRMDQTRINSLGCCIR
jgi:hypothetical protein